MTIIKDGSALEVPDRATVAQVLELCGEPPSHGLVEVNGVFVHPRNYPAMQLNPGDRLEVIYPAFGG